MNNRAEAINIRRETVGMELTAVHGAIRLLESIVVQSSEENDEAIAMLQSLMDQPQSAKSQIDLIKSESDLSAAKTLLEEWTGLGDVIGQLTVTKDDKKYRVKEASSTVHAKACVLKTMLTYLLNQLKVSNLLAEELAQTPENSPQAAAVANIPSIPVCSKDRSVPPTPRHSLLHSQRVSLRFSINGDLKQQVVIQLCPQEAPKVIELDFITFSNLFIH